MPKKAHSPSVADVLTSICVAINAAEGCDHMTVEAESIREALYVVKNRIGTLPQYQNNRQLGALDAAFTKAGWDHQGLRWTSEDRDITDIFIVQFLDTAHTRWKIA